MTDFNWVKIDFNDKSTYPTPNSELIFLFKANPTIICHGCFFNDTGEDDFVLFRFGDDFSIKHDSINMRKIKCYAYVTVGHFLKYKNKGDI